MLHAADWPITHAFREFFLLEQAQAFSSRLSAAAHTTVRAYHDAARVRISAARSLRGSTEVSPALSLYREAGLCLARAVIAASKGSDGIDVHALSPQATLEELDRVLANVQAALPASLETARAVLAAADPLALDALAADNPDQKVDALESGLRWLSTLVEPRSPAQLRAARVVRLSAAALCALAVLVGLGIWAFSPKNLALGKTARSSSSAYETAPAGAVDGDKSTRFGFHSQEEDSPWLAIDLGRRSSISRVEAYGRGDCCYDQSVPLALEVSDDGTLYRQVAERKDPFSQADPWIVVLKGVTGRFVRLRTERRSVLVLSEVEVYGHRKF